LREVDLKFGIPLIEAASLEEDDLLQDMFAALLVNSTDGDGETKAHRSYVSILQDFGHLEAVVLEALCHHGKVVPEVSIKTDFYADDESFRVEWRIFGWANEQETNLPDEVELALWNLARLGCITRSLMRACTVTKKSERGSRKSEKFG
jgi:hypothetical protein